MIRKKASMEESKKRKLVSGIGHTKTKDEISCLSSEKHMRWLLTPLGKDQLIDMLIKLSMQIPEVAEEIKGVASVDPVYRRLFVRGLAWETNSETLNDAFSVHGEIEEGAVIVDKATGKSRGFGFVTFKDMESAQKALEEPSKLIDGRLAICNLACEGFNSASASVDVAFRKVYVGGLSPKISTEALLNFFRKHGEIEEGSVAYDKDTNTSRGFGFVTYKTAEAAKNAISDSNKLLAGKSITVKYADSQQKGKVMQSQSSSAVVPLALPISSYPLATNSPTRAANASVAYAPYMYGSHYATAQPQYLVQSQLPYSHVLRTEPYGMHPPSPTGLSGYSYYYARP